MNRQDQLSIMSKHSGLPRIDNPTASKPEPERVELSAKEKSALIKLVNIARSELKFRLKDARNDRAWDYAGEIELDIRVADAMDTLIRRGRVIIERESL